MTQPHKILFLAVFVAALLLLPLRGAAQSATVTDDGFLSSSTATQQVNLNGQGIVLIVAGSSAAVGSAQVGTDRKSTRLNSSHSQISYAGFCLKKKKPRA